MLGHFGDVIPSVLCLVYALTLLRKTVPVVLIKLCNAVIWIYVSVSYSRIPLAGL